MDGPAAVRCSGRVAGVCAGGSEEWRGGRGPPKPTVAWRGPWARKLGRGITAGLAAAAEAVADAEDAEEEEEDGGREGVALTAGRADGIVDGGAVAAECARCFWSSSFVGCRFTSSLRMPKKPVRPSAGHMASRSPLHSCWDATGERSIPSRRPACEDAMGRWDAS
jgi:hypothetical protein